jgi:hypothetical protein
MKFKVLTLILSILILNAQGQTEEEKPKPLFKHALYESPLHLFAGKIKIDYENFNKHPFYTPGLSLIFGSTNMQKEDQPRIYKNTVGLEFNNKIYMKDISKWLSRNNSFYLNFVLSYSHMNFRYAGNEWTPYTENGIEYFELKEDVPIKPVADRIGFSPQMGYVVTNHRLILDFYFGAMIYKDFVRKEQEAVELPLNPFRNANLNSMMPQMGMRIGILL